MNKKHSAPVDESLRYKKARTVGLWGGLKNIFLASSKLIIGISGHSHALLADGIHSLADLVIDGVVIVASKVGSKAADEDHPYGHGRIETAATVFLALVLAAAAIGIIVNAGYTLFSPSVHSIPAPSVMVITLLSILFNEILYFWTRSVAKQINSKLLLSNAWHHRADSASSLLVALGVLGAWFGFPKFDAIAAILVSFMILKISWNFGWHSVRELVDTVPNLKETEDIKQYIQKIPGVEAIHQFRIRSIAGASFCDVHVLVDPKLSVTEGHYIGQNVETCLTQKFPDITDVTVHIDTEDDQANNPSLDLPSRATLIPLLNQLWINLLPNDLINQTTLHYQNGKIFLELKLPLSYATHSSLSQELKKMVNSEHYIADISIFYY